MKIEDYQRLSQQIDKLKEQQARDKGALEQVLARLDEEFGCKTLEQAKAVLSKLEKDNAKLIHTADQQLAEFKERWRDVLS
jgi:hypothetical protein